MPTIDAANSAPRILTSKFPSPLDFGTQLWIVCENGDANTNACWRNLSIRAYEATEDGAKAETKRTGADKYIDDKTEVTSPAFWLRILCNKVDGPKENANGREADYHRSNELTCCIINEIVRHYDQHRTADYRQ
jgi:hypothetical protein